MHDFLNIFFNEDV